jgi:hypothetical protein
VYDSPRLHWCSIVSQACNVVSVLLLPQSTETSRILPIRAVATTSCTTRVEWTHSGSHVRPRNPLKMSWAGGISCATNSRQAQPQYANSSWRQES